MIYCSFKIWKLNLKNNQITTGHTGKISQITMTKKILKKERIIQIILSRDISTIIKLEKSFMIFSHAVKRWV